MIEIAHNQADVTGFNKIHLPPIVPFTQGVAYPKDEATAVLCIAPGEAIAPNEREGQDLNLHFGDPHLAIDSDPLDTYPNQVFSRDYSVVRAVGYDDSLARVLREFWASQGFDKVNLRQAWLEYLKRFREDRRPSWFDLVWTEVQKGEVFFFAKKDQPVMVAGIVDMRFQTSEGPKELKTGDAVVYQISENGSQDWWVIGAKKLAERYDYVPMPSGLLVPRR